MNTDIYVLYIYVVYVLLYLNGDVQEELIIFRFQKFSLRVLPSICLIFCQFQPGVVYKSVAYIYKKACIDFYSHTGVWEMSGCSCSQVL